MVVGITVDQVSLVPRFTSASTLLDWESDALSRPLGIFDYVGNHWPILMRTATSADFKLFVYHAYMALGHNLLSYAHRRCAIFELERNIGQFELWEQKIEEFETRFLNTCVPWRPYVDGLRELSMVRHSRIGKVFNHPAHRLQRTVERTWRRFQTRNQTLNTDRLNLERRASSMQLDAKELEEAVSSALSTALVFRARSSINENPSERIQQEA